MTGRTRTVTLQVDEELYEFLSMMVSDGGPYRSVSAYFEALIRCDMESQEAVAFKQLQAELAAGFSAPESSYHPCSAAEVIARNRQ